MALSGAAAWRCSAAGVPSGPVALDVSASSGSWSLIDSYRMTLDASGDLTVITHGEGGGERTRRLSEGELADLRRVLHEERVFELPDFVGARVVDSGSRTLEVSWNGRRRSLRIGHMGYTHDLSELGEERRAARVWRHVRGWFEHAEAVDYRELDRAVFGRAFVRLVLRGLRERLSDGP